MNFESAWILFMDSWKLDLGPLVKYNFSRENNMLLCDTLFQFTVVSYSYLQFSDKNNDGGWSSNA